MTTATALISNVLARTLRPRHPLTVSEWADANRMLSEVGSAEPGRWKTSRTPYLREIMDCLSEHHPARKVVFRKSSQVGGTEVGSNWLGYIMCHAKGPVAVVMPTDRSLTDWMSQKFDPMADETPAVGAVLANRNNRSADNNAQRKKFAGGILYTKTAGSTADLKSTSLRYAIADEVDEYEWDTGQGSPLGLLDVRVTTYHDSKLFIVSSPTVKDASTIDAEFDGGDQRHYHLPCPHCGHYQKLQWGSLRWQHTAGLQRQDIKHAWYVCNDCGCEIHEHEKPSMLARGQWIAEAPGAAYPSFHIHALYSPNGLGKTWAQLADQWVKAQDDHRALQLFLNTRLGESWADRSRDIKPNALIARAEPYLLRKLPDGVLVITAGVDVQDDRFEIAVWGHGFEGTTRIRWVIDYHVIPGRPSEAETWAALADYLLAARFGLDNGRTLGLEATGIDIGGHHTHDVYAFVRSRRVPRCIACKGASTPGRAILGKPSLQDVNWKGQSIKKGVALYLVGSDVAKHLLYGLLDGDAERAPHERRVRFSSALDDKWFDGLVAEVFNPRKNRWEIKKGKRNEPLDTFVLAEAASHHPELYLHKWRAVDWKRRARMLGVDEESINGAGGAAGAVAEPAGQDSAPAPAPPKEPAPKPARGRPARRGRIGGGKW